MLELRNIHKSYEGQPLLRGIFFSVRSRETVCLLGPSGSGKSTILQLIAGLERPESGQILWNGHDLSSVPAHLRDFGLVFQDYALFPHLNVRENVSFGPRMRGWSPGEIDARIAEVLELVDLSNFSHRSVDDLSGGEQQRVALARALAPRPRLLMFDEPLGALDRPLREELLNELRHVLARAGIPAIYVTHDQEEAFKIGDRVLLLHQGRIIREGSPHELWARPGSAWAAAFLGLGNIVEGHLSSARRAETDIGSLAFRCSHRHRVGEVVHLLLRPVPTRVGALIRGSVADVSFQPNGYRVVLANGIYFDQPEAPRKGARLSVRLQPECLGADAVPGFGPGGTK